MRKFLEKYYERSELIINTGYSYQFVTNLEKHKYKEMYLPNEDLDPNWDPDRLRVDTIMIQQEVDEIVDRFKEEGKPFAHGEIEGSNFKSYTNGMTELDLVKMVQDYHKKRKDKVVDTVGAAIEKECKEWNMLTSRQKQMVIDLIIELANK